MPQLLSIPAPNTSTSASMTASPSARRMARSLSPTATTASSPQPATTSGCRRRPATVTGTGLLALDKVTDVNLIAIPGQGDPPGRQRRHGLLQELAAICRTASSSATWARSRASTTPGSTARQPTVRTVADARDFATTGFGGTPLDKAAGDYGAIYFPWVWSADPIGSGRNPRILLPPSGVPRRHLRPHRQLARRVQGPGRHRSRRRRGAWRRRRRSATPSRTS